MPKGYIRNPYARNNFESLGYSVGDFMHAFGQGDATESAGYLQSTQAMADITGKQLDNAETYDKLKRGRASDELDIGTYMSDLGISEDTIGKAASGDFEGMDPKQRDLLQRATEGFMQSRMSEGYKNPLGTPYAEGVEAYQDPNRIKGQAFDAMTQQQDFQPTPKGFRQVFEALDPHAPPGSGSGPRTKIDDLSYRVAMAQGLNHQQAEYFALLMRSAMTNAETNAAFPLLMTETIKDPNAYMEAVAEASGTSLTEMMGMAKQMAPSATDRQIPSPAANPSPQQAPNKRWVVKDGQLVQE